MKKPKIKKATYDLIAMLLNRSAKIDRSHTTKSIEEKLPIVLKKAYKSDELSIRELADDIEKLAAKLDDHLKYLEATDFGDDKALSQLEHGQAEGMNIYLATAVAKLLYTS